MADVTVSKSVAWVQQIGQNVTTTVLQNVVAPPTVPSNAFDAVQTVEGGIYTATFKNYGDLITTTSPTSGDNVYNYEVHCVTQTEPLLTFWKFQSTAAGGSVDGPWALSPADLTIIAECEAGSDSNGSVTRFSDYISSGDGYSDASTGLKAYCILKCRGIDSYEHACITLSITDEESSFPSMASVGTIQSVTNAPTLPTSGNWLLTGIDASSLSNGKWKVTRNYKGSGAYGWEPTLYAA